MIASQEKANSRDRAADLCFPHYFSWGSQDPSFASRHVESSTLGENNRKATNPAGTLASSSCQRKLRRYDQAVSAHPSSLTIARRISSSLGRAKLGEWPVC